MSIIPTWNRSDIIGTPPTNTGPYIPFTEEEWANEVLMFEGAEASQTHIHEFRKTVSFECRNLAVPQSVRKKIVENRGVKSPGLDKLADHKQRAVSASQKGVESIVPNLAKSFLY